MKLIVIEEPVALTSLGAGGAPGTFAAVAYSKGENSLNPTPFRVLYLNL